MAQITYTIQAKRDTAANWTANNPTLAEGEFGFETDTKKLKIGDGNTLWASLPYKILTDDIIGVANGVAPLNASGTIDPEYVRHNAGWRDNIMQFVKGSPGVNAPTLTTLGNGALLYEFGVNDSVHVEFHVDHDVLPNSLAYPHIHFLSTSAMTAGQTVTWNFTYVSAIGYSQGASLTGTRTVINMTYTADGTEIAGEHIILEATTGVTLVEPDQVLLAEYTYTGGTHGGTIYGIMGDLHYQSDREVTLNKAPNFYA